MPKHAPDLSQDTPAASSRLGRLSGRRRRGAGVTSPDAAIRFPDDTDGLPNDSEWQLKVLDEHGKPVFRIGPLVESLESPTRRVSRLHLAEGLADIDRHVEH